jgi:hypothetical protein
MADQEERQDDRDARRSDWTTWIIAVVVGFAVLALLLFGVTGEEEQGSNVSHSTNATSSP